jgi:hypothetical protein
MRVTVVRVIEIRDLPGAREISEHKFLPWRKVHLMILDVIRKRAVGYSIEILNL